MRFSRSTHLLMYLSLETLTSIIRTGLPIPVELIDLVNPFIIFLSQTALLKWLTFLLGSQTMILTVLLFWIYLFLLTLVFVLQRISLRWEILIMLLSEFPLIFHHVNKISSCNYPKKVHTFIFTANPFIILKHISNVSSELRSSSFHLYNIIHKNSYFCQGGYRDKLQ